jgi:hypothetical protein
MKRPSGNFITSFNSIIYIFRLREEKKREREEESRLRLEKVKAAKAKEERQSSSFVSYFSKVDTKEPKTWGWSNEVFKPFQIKEKVVIAPIHRRDPLSDDCHNCLLSISLEVLRLNRFKFIFKFRRVIISKRLKRSNENVLSKNPCVQNTFTSTVIIDHPIMERGVK